MAQKQTLKDVGIKGKFILTKKNKDRILDYILNEKFGDESEWLKNETVELACCLLDFLCPTEDRLQILEIIKKQNTKTSIEVSNYSIHRDAFSFKREFQVFFTDNVGMKDWVAVGDPSKVGLYNSFDFNFSFSQWAGNYPYFRLDYYKKIFISSLPDELQGRLKVFTERVETINDKIQNLRKEYQKAMADIKSVFVLVERIPKMKDIINSLIDVPFEEKPEKKECSDIPNVDAAKKLSDIL